MARGATVSRSFRAAVAIAAVLAASAAAVAGEVCVTCNGPDANYRCQIESGGKLERAGERAAQYVCVTELARQGGHASCSVRRDGFPSCVGDLKIIDLTGQAPPPAPAPAPAVPAAAADAAPPGPAAAPAEAQSGPPKTMVELAKRTGEASKAELQKTGRAVGGAVQKTWDCLTSLFKQC